MPEQKGINIQEQTKEIANETNWTWSRRKHLKRETKSMVIINYFFLNCLKNLCKGCKQIKPSKRANINHRNKKIRSYILSSKNTMNWLKMNTNSSKSFGQLFIRNKRRLYDINAQHYQKPVLGIGKVIFRRILRFKYDHQKTKPHCYQLRKN